MVLVASAYLFQVLS